MFLNQLVQFLKLRHSLSVAFHIENAKRFTGTPCSQALSVFTSWYTRDIKAIRTPCSSCITWIWFSSLLQASLGLRDWNAIQVHLNLSIWLCMQMYVFFLPIYMPNTYLIFFLNLPEVLQKRGGSLGSEGTSEMMLCGIRQTNRACFWRTRWTAPCCSPLWSLKQASGHMMFLWEHTVKSNDTHQRFVICFVYVNNTKIDDILFAFPP